MVFSNVFLLLLYLVPGFIGYHLYRLRFPAKKTSDTITIIWCIIHTFIIHFILGCIGYLAGIKSLNYISAIHDSIDLKSVLLLLISGFAYGGILVGIQEINIRLNIFPTDPLSIWMKINLRTKEAGGCWVVVFLKDNKTIYQGWISEFTFDPNIENQDFLLAEAWRVDEKLNKVYEIKGLGVYLNTRDIKCIEYLEPV